MATKTATRAATRTRMRTRTGTLTRSQIAAIEEHGKQLQQIADRLRETADGLQLWYQTQAADIKPPVKSVHPIHAANRLRKLASELAKEQV